MPQAVIKGQGGTVETYFLDRQVATCTIALYTGDGALKKSGAGAVDSVATALSAQAAAGATSLSLASAAGVVAGRRYLLGGDGQGQPPEVVTVRDLNGTTANLWAPTLYRHVNAATFKGTRVSVVVADTDADVLWWDGYCDFTPDTGDIVTEVVDSVLRKIPERLIDETDIYDIFPKTGKMLDAELDVQSAMRKARDNFLRDLGGKFRAHCMLGTVHLRRACAMRFWLDRRHALGPDWAQNMDALDSDYQHEIQKLQSQIPVDNDQDGVTTGPNDGGFTSGRVQRA